MPWTTREYPNSMKFLSPKVREKAIDIANALLEEKTMQEGVIVATAISHAKDWAANRGIEAKTEVKPRTTEIGNGKVTGNTSVSIKNKKGRQRRKISSSPQKKIKSSPRHA